MVKKSYHLFCYFCSELQHHTCILCSHLMKYWSYTLFMTNRDNHDGVIHPFMLVFNYDSLETWRKEKTRPSPENLERWNIYSHEWKRSKNGRMEQLKAMEYESQKASSDVLKLRNIYVNILFRCILIIYISCYSLLWPSDCIILPLSSPTISIKFPTDTHLLVYTQLQK